MHGNWAGKGYIAIQSCDDGWDYTLYHSDYSVMDSGQIDAPELTIQEVREEILEAHHMEKGRRLIQDSILSWTEPRSRRNLGTNHRPSTLEKLASLAGAKEKCDAPECSPVGCRKVRDAHELNGEELTLMMLYNSGSRPMVVVQELAAAACVP